MTTPPWDIIDARLLAKEREAMRLIQRTGQTTSDDEPTDNFTDTDPFPRRRSLLRQSLVVARERARYRRLRAARRLRWSAEKGALLLVALTLLCCRNDHAVFVLFYALCGVLALWLAAAAWLFVERRSL